MSKKNTVSILRAHMSFMVTITATVCSFMLSIWLLANRSMSNVFRYAVSVIVAMLVMLLFSMITGRFPEDQDKFLKEQSLKKVTTLTVVLAVIWTAVWIHMYYHTMKMFDAPSGYAWQTIPPYAFLGIVACLLAGLYFVEHRYRIFEQAGYEKGIYFLMAVLTVYAGITYYWPSNLCSGYTNYHADAYFNNIYNAYYGEPYSELNFGTYGHYGILAGAILHIIGLDKFPELMMGLSVICVLLSFYCMNTLVRNTFIKIFSVLAMLIVNARADATLASHQGIPHRMIFPLIVCALAVWGVKHKKLDNWIYKGTLYFIAALSIQWNFETGICCAISVAFLFCLCQLNRDSGAMKMVLGIALHILLVGGAFLLGWGLTSIWNVLQGGQWLPLRQFLVPIFSIDNDVNFALGLELPLQSGNSLWLHIVILMFFFLVLAILKSKAFGSAGTTDAQLSCSVIAVMCIGTLTFFINRAGFGGLYIAFYYTVILLGVLAEWSVSWTGKYQHNTVMYGIAHTIKVMIGSLVFLLAVMTVVLSLQFQTNRVALIKEQIEFEEAYLAKVEEVVPANTPALGNGVAYIYSQLGWENPIKICDLPAMGSSDQAMKYISQIGLSDLPLFRLSDERLKDQGIVTEVGVAGGYDYCYYEPVSLEPYQYRVAPLETDGWIGNFATLKIQTGVEKELSIYGYYPFEITGNEIMYVTCGSETVEYQIKEPNFCISVEVPPQEIITIELDSSKFARIDLPDERRLSYIFHGIAGYSIQKNITPLETYQFRSSGIHEDGWVGPQATMIAKTGTEEKMDIYGYYPFEITGNETIYVTCGAETTEYQITEHSFCISVEVPKEEIIAIKLDSSKFARINPPDVRELSFLFSGVAGYTLQEK